MTPDVLAKLRELLRPNPTLVQWRTVWRLHVEFELMLRFDDVKRLKVKSPCPPPAPLQRVII